MPAHYRDSEFVFANIHLGFRPRCSITKRGGGARHDDGSSASVPHSEVLARTDLMVNEGEARQLAHEHNMVRAARAIRALGPKIVIIKRG